MGEKKAEDHEMRRVNELERFRVMISNPVKYNGVPGLEEAALMRWLEMYRNGKEEKGESDWGRTVCCIESDFGNRDFT